MLALLTPLLIPALFQAPAAVDTVPIKEFQVPWEKTRPRDPFVDSKGTVWFVGQAGHYVGRLDPRTGQFTRFDLEDGTGPHNIIVGKGDALWYSGNRASHIGRLDPATGKIQKFMMPDSTVRDPHTLIEDASGTIWFTAQQSNKVGRFDPSTGEVKLIPVATTRSRPYGIVVDPAGNPWFTLFGSNKLGRIDTKTLTVKEFVLPAEGARPRRIAATPDGIIWYVDYTRGYLGRLDPATGAVKEWANPSGARSLPYAMTSDDAGRVWFVETGVQPNRMVGFDPKTETFFSQTPIPGGGGTVRHMMFDAPSRSIWYGSDTGQIGRATVPPGGGRVTP